MLQRKLLLVLGSLVLLLLVTAFTAILMLNAVLGDLNEFSQASLDRTAHANALSTTVLAIETELSGLHLHEEPDLTALREAVETLQVQAAELDGIPGLAEPATRLRDLLPVFVQHVGDLETVDSTEALRAHTDDVLLATIMIRRAIVEVGRAFEDQTSAAHDDVTTRFRWLVLGLGLVFLVVINLSIIVLIRAASMVLRPVDKLVEASRRLGREEFDHPIGLHQHDEFGELASAYEHLAGQLRQNEQRKIETLHQVARTLNHELNNAIAIIELQLQLVARGGRGEPDLEDRLHQIHDTLARMTDTVESLKHVRRIVLTDYVEGVKMLDLPRSVEDEPAPEGVAADRPELQPHEPP